MAKIRRIAWAPSFRRAFKKRVVGTPAEEVFERRVQLFLDDPFSPSLRTHRLSGTLDGLWAFSVGYDCRVVFDFVSEDEVLLIDIGSHDEVY